MPTSFERALCGFSAGTSGHAVCLRVLERPAPGSDFLDCEFIVSAGTVNGSFPVGITSDDLDK
ncbi:DUF5959 family protein [Kitasatospora sp. MAA4]|uniref:DUF5959 family protein n=1 Tax=Kitasatospora sp. MAA4 TaxID=3035093 RepID=UPI0024742681|nr:DUF5959 family protein [Kitasatospora sp. MAA4]